jgi:hypothetical protein
MLQANPHRAETNLRYTCGEEKIMCRSIKQLRQSDAQPTTEEIHAAALQFVRKVSGYRQPSKRNQIVFDHAVNEIASATQKLLAELETLRAQSESTNQKSLKAQNHRQGVTDA